MPHSFLPETIPHKLWGSQSWLQPAFQPASTGWKDSRGAKKPPGKAAAGKIACPTANAEHRRREKYVALGESACPTYGA
jgi:hypothetical protein